MSLSSGARAFSTCGVVRRGPPSAYVPSTTSVTQPVTRHYKYNFRGKTYTLTRELKPAPAPRLPSTSWTAPVHQVPNRKPVKSMYRVRLGTDAPLKELTHTPMTRKEAVRANTLYIRHSGQKCSVQRDTPGMCQVPPVAVPKTTEMPMGPGANGVVQKLLDQQVRGGDYAPYERANLVHSAAIAKEAAKKPEARVISEGAQALSQNASMHPISRRYLLERVGAQLKTQT